MSEAEIKKRLQDLRNLEMLHEKARERVKNLEQENRKLKEKVKALEEENNFLKRAIEGVSFELEQVKIKLYWQETDSESDSPQDREEGTRHFFIQHCKLRNSTIQYRDTITARPQGRAVMIKTSIQCYHNLRQKVSFLYQKLTFRQFELTKGRKLLISIIDIITLGLFRARENIGSKKSLAEIFNLSKHYKTLVVNLNKFAKLIAFVIFILARSNRVGSHPIKHTDSTDIPVCLPKNASRHQTMKALADWG